MTDPPAVDGRNDKESGLIFKTSMFYFCSNPLATISHVILSLSEEGEYMPPTCPEVKKHLIGVSTKVSTTSFSLC